MENFGRADRLEKETTKNKTQGRRQLGKNGITVKPLWWPRIGSVFMDNMSKL